MKRIKPLLFSLMLLCSAFVRAATVIGPGTRLWDLEVLIDNSFDITESKVDLLGINVETEFSSVFTVLQPLVDKSCTIDSIVDSIDTNVSKIDIQLNTVESTVDIIDENIEFITSDIDIIRINDFGGTWTAIEGIQENLCSKFELMFDDLDIICSKIDFFSEQELVNFVATFTTIEEIADDVLDTLTIIQQISINTKSQLDEIDIMLIMLKGQATTICSKVELIDINVEIGFEGTFTALQAVQEKACSIDSKVDALLDIVSQEMSGTFTAIEVILQKSCTLDSQIDKIDECVSIIDDAIVAIDSKSDVFITKVCDVESLVDLLDVLVVSVDSKVDLVEELICTVESKVDQLSIDVALSKVCVIDSKVDVVSQTLSTVSSTVDQQIINAVTVESLVDKLDDTTDIVFSKLCVIDSKVAELDTDPNTVDSKVDIVDSLVDIMCSSLEIVDMSAILSKVCTVESRVDLIDIQIQEVIEQYSTINSKFDVIDTSMTTFDSSVDVVQVLSQTIDSKINVLDVHIDMSLQKACTVESLVDGLDSKVDLNDQCITTLDSRLDELVVDFQETWTILQVIEDKACLVSDNFITVNSSLNFLGTFTGLAELQEKMCIIESKVLAIDVGQPACVVQADLDGTFTMLDAICSKSITVESKVDVADTTVFDVADNFGIPIRQADVGATGFIATAPGRYFLAENITFNPSMSGVAAITFDSDNIEFLMLRRTITQSGIMNDVDGLRITQGTQGVDIKDGTIRDFSGNGVAVETEASNIFLRSMNIKDAGENGVDFDQSCTSIIIEDAMIAGCSGDGINIDSASDLIIRESMITNNGSTTTNSGIAISNCNRVLVSQCMTTTNRGDGFSFISTATSTEIVIQDCKSFENDVCGILFSHVDDSVIKGCVCNENGTDGIRVNDCINVEIIQNFCIDNADDGIVLGTESTGSSDCYVAENSMLLTGSVNLREEGGSGPNSILSNFALAVSAGDNYVTDSGFTFLNLFDLDQESSGSPPVKWFNISMTT